MQGNNGINGELAEAIHSKFFYSFIFEILQKFFLLFLNFPENFFCYFFKFSRIFHTIFCEFSKISFHLKPFLFLPFYSSFIFSNIIAGQILLTPSIFAILFAKMLESSFPSFAHISAIIMWSPVDK